MGLSLQDRVAALPEVERLAWLAEQPPYLVEEMLRGEWWWVSRPEQVPPAGGWFVCLALAGRGFGKSRSGSEWIVNQVLKNPYDSSGTPTEWLVIAETLSDARTICMEGPAGILRVLERRKIRYRYKMSPRPMVLFPNGSKIYTEGADDPDVGRGYNLSGGWLDELCVAKDELVITARGQVPVQDVRAGDLVLTRKGWRPVIYAGLTRQNTEVLEIRTTSGTVRVTPEHKVWANGQWVDARYVAPYDIMETCQQEMKTQSRVKLPPSMTGMVSVGTSTKEWATISIGLDHCSIDVSGLRNTDQSQMTMKSTTSTGSAGTIGSATWSFLQSTTTGPLVASNETMRHGLVTRLRRLPLNDLQPIGNGDRHGRSFVPSAVLSTLATECGLNSVAPPVGRQPVERRTTTLVVDVVKVSAPTDVYDITVAGDAPEFFAGDGRLLIHNCKWRWPKRSWEEGIMPSLRADLTGDHPRAFVTTTPKPIDILQEWVKRDDGTIHVIRGSTFDNQSNLSSLVIDELRRRYEGTTIGRQELYGDIIEAFDGALFARIDIENNRIDDTPDDLVATVVGVDPSLTGEDDEMGIIVVSRDRQKHLYVQADRSVMAVGRAAALAAWRVVAEFSADKLVVEENLGKRWMQQVFHDAYFELVGTGLFPAHTKPPLVRIDTKIGKRTRGEPVAMRCEQGRLHMVGHHPRLEDQMATFTGWGTNESPDRLDALVHACRFLMDGEKKEARIASPRDVLSSTLQSLWQDAGSYSNF